MSKPYKVAVIGGGASGLLCAVELLRGKGSLEPSDVVLLEKNDRVGKKLAATGNGQGNICNADLSAEHYYGDAEFISAFIENAEKIDIRRYFSDLGIPVVTEADGRQYPLSKQANAVLDIIRLNLSYKKCNILTGAKVDKITEKKGVFNVFYGENAVKAQNVVLATGGAAAKQFGTDGTAYVLAENFGHKLTGLYPSLVQLKTELAPVRGLKGLKETARVSLYDGEKFLCSSLGDLLFTEYGVSGNAVFKVSSRVGGAKNPVLKIELLPEMPREKISETLEKRKKLGYLEGGALLLGIINKKIGEAVIKTVGTDVNKIANTLKNFTLKVTGTLGFEYAQVTKGGIDTKDVTPQMESRLKRGLYVTGEALDVDGDCGGYNLAFAFTSGIIAAKNIKKQNIQGVNGNG